MTCPGWGVLLFSQESWTAHPVEALLCVTGPIGPLLESLLLVSRWPQQALQTSLESVWEGCAQQRKFWKPQPMVGQAPVEQPARHPSTLWPLMIQVPPAGRPQNHASLLLLAYDMQQSEKQVICPCKTHIPWGSTGKVNRHPVQKGKEGRTPCSHGHSAGLKCSRPADAVTMRL